MVCGKSLFRDALRQFRDECNLVQFYLPVTTGPSVHLGDYGYYSDGVFDRRGNCLDDLGRGDSDPGLVIDNLNNQTMRHAAGSFRRAAVGVQMNLPVPIDGIGQTFQLNTQISFETAGGVGACVELFFFRERSLRERAFWAALQACETNILDRLRQRDNKSRVPVVVMKLIEGPGFFSLQTARSRAATFTLTVSGNGPDIAFGSGGSMTSCIASNSPTSFITPFISVATYQPPAGLVAYTFGEKHHAERAEAPGATGERLVAYTFGEKHHAERAEAPGATGERLVAYTFGEGKQAQRAEAPAAARENPTPEIVDGFDLISVFGMTTKSFVVALPDDDDEAQRSVHQRTLQNVIDANGPPPDRIPIPGTNQIRLEFLASEQAKTYRRLLMARGLKCSQIIEEK